MLKYVWIPIIILGGRLLRVDHVREFKPPKEYLDLSPDDPEIFDKLYKPTGPDGKGWGEFR